MTLRAVAFNCTLKGGNEASSTELLLRQLLSELAPFDVTGEVLRMADYDIRPGVTSDEGDGDDWPGLRETIMQADIFLLGTPIWMGQPSSICKRVMERLDAFLSEKDDLGRMPAYGKVAAAVITGNEDGAHHCSAMIYQALNDVGFTIPANAVTYWVGEAMGKTDYRDLEETPEMVASTNRLVARNIAHLAGLLKRHQYPGEKQGEHEKAA